MKAKKASDRAITPAAFKPLSPQKRKIMERISRQAAQLLKYKPATLEILREYVQANGTDHEDGASVDSLTERILELVQEERENWG